MSFENYFVHFGACSFDPKKFKPVKNGFKREKPKGGTGFWASPVNSELSWQRFLIKERKLSPWDFAFDFFCFEISEGAKVLEIHEEKDLLKLPFVTLKKQFRGISFERNHIDFETLSQEYDAVFMSEAGVHSTAFSDYIWMSGWDVESLLVMNPKIIKQIN